MLRHLLLLAFLGISSTGATLLKDVECAAKIEAVHECSSPNSLPQSHASIQYLQDQGPHLPLQEAVHEAQQQHQPGHQVQ